MVKPEQPEQTPCNGDSGTDESTSSNLLNGLRHREDGAWCRLVEIWTPFIYGHCRRRGFTPEDADDITQSVFVRVYRGLANFERDGAGKRFRYWIMAIARNEIADFCRRNGDKPQAAGGSDCHAILESLPALDDESSTDWCQPAQLLCRALEVIQGDFQPANWHAFQMIEFEKLPIREVAEKLEMNEGAVRQATFRIRKRLKAELEGMLE